MPDWPKDLPLPQIISNGTLREEDLIPRFVHVALELCAWRKRHFDRQWNLDNDRLFYESELWRIEDRIRHVDLRQGPEKGRPYFGSEQARYDLNEFLFNVLNRLAPDGFTFSSHEGDGACFGFFPEE
jgi:hypothetical protein